MQREESANAAQETNPFSTPDRRSLLTVFAGLAVLDFAMFFDVLFFGGSRVLGFPATDLPHLFLPSRAFGFNEVAQGHFPLWNPHIFAGVPYFGGMQSALLYPPNWLFALLPLPAAANWSIALNVWLLGAGMAAWVLCRGLSRLAAGLGAVVLMFGAPHFLHVSGGHVTLLAAMAWAPLVFLAIDGWLDTRRATWSLLGMLAVAIQVFAGSPQHVFITAVAAGIYALLRLYAAPARHRLASAAGLLAIYAGGSLLAAAQLLAGIEASSETIRGQQVPIAFAASFAFPFENLVTLFAPGFFGDVGTEPYWGRWYLWEACAFMGVGGLMLAAYGTTATLLAKRALIAVGAISFLLALGDATPLFGVLYERVPLFDRLRGMTKFMFPVALVLALFAAHGFDRILRERTVPRAALWACALLAIVLFLAAAAVRTVDWAAVMDAVFRTRQTYADPWRYAQDGPRAAAQAFASNGLIFAALTVAAVGALAWQLRRQRTGAAYLLAVLAAAEVFAFARLHRPTFDAAKLVVPELQEYLAQHPGDYRTLNLQFPNGAMLMGNKDAWGYDPFVSRRYAQFMTWSEGNDPSLATDYVVFRHFHPLLSMLRVRYVVNVRGNEMVLAPTGTPPLSRLELIGSYRVKVGRDEVLRAMGQASFDPRREVILEQVPQPAPVASADQGRVALVREGTDFLEIAAELSSPSILLVTDAWAPGWRAFGLQDGETKQYPVMPANYALRAVALDRGRHYVRLEYAPPAFRTGVATSVLAWIAWLAALFWHRRR